MLFGVDRVNVVYRLKFLTCLKKAITGYYMESFNYNSFVARNFRWFVVFFAYASIVLNALQVGLASADGQKNALFNRFGWIASILVMAMLVGGIAFVVLALLIVVLENAVFACVMLKRALRHTRTMSV